MNKNQNLNDGVLMLHDHEPIELYYDDEKAQLMMNTINNCISIGNALVKQWEEFFNEPFEFSAVQSLLSIKTPVENYEVPKREYLRPLSIKERVEKDKPGLIKILKDMYVEKQGITISGLNVNNSKIGDLLSINVSFDLVNSLSTLKGWVSNLSILKPGVISLNDLYNGREFYFPSEINDKVFGSWFSVYTSSKEQNEALEACWKLQEVFETFRKLSIRLPKQGMLPPLFQDIFDNALGDQFEIRKNIFSRRNFNHL